MAACVQQQTITIAVGFVHGPAVLDVVMVVVAVVVVVVVTAVIDVTVCTCDKQYITNHVYAL